MHGNYSNASEKAEIDYEKMANLLSIIIVNFNGIKYLGECLQSIAKHAACPHEVIVVDNASTDGSCDYLRSRHPEVTVVTSDWNLGFAGGNNLGVIHARGDLFLLLNNDTRLLSSLVPAIRAFENNEQLGVLGCRMSYADGSIQPSMGYEHTPLRVVLSWAGFGGALFAPSIFKRVDNNGKHYSSPREAAWVSGAFLMTSRTVWDRLGGLDERYFMYAEDVDYCKRVRLVGYRVAYTPDVEIIHYEGGGKSWIGVQALKSSISSYFVYTRKYHTHLSVFGTWLGLCLVMTVRTLVLSLSALVSRSEITRQKAKGYRELLPYLYSHHLERK